MKQPLKFSFVLFVMAVFILSAAVLGSPGSTLAQDEPSPLNDPTIPGSEQTSPPLYDPAVPVPYHFTSSENSQTELVTQNSEMVSPKMEELNQSLLLSALDSPGDGFLYVLDDRSTSNIMEVHIVSVHIINSL